MVKDAPGLGKIAAMVLFALSCFGLLLFLWLAFGGPVPLKPKGYRFHTSFAEAGQLALEADVRISGVPGRQGQDDHAGQGDRPLRRRDPAAVALRAAAVGREGDPAPEDAAGRDLRRAHAGPRTRARRSPRAGMLPASQVSDTVELDEILRAFDPKTRAAFQDWMQTQAQAIGGRGQDLNDALGNLAPFAEDTANIVDILNRQEGAVSRLIANTGVVFEALSERDGQLRSLIENSNTVFATTAARDERAQGLLPRAADLRGRVAQDVRPPDRVLRRRPTRWSRSCGPRRASCRRRCRTWRDISPDLKNLLEQLQPLIDASKTGFPAAEQVLEDTRPLLGQLVPATAQLTPAVDFIGLYKRELALVLRQLGRRDAGQGRGHVSCTTCAPRTRSTSRTSPSIRAGCRPTARTRTGCRTGSTRSTRAWPSTRTASARRRT